MLRKNVFKEVVFNPEVMTQYTGLGKNQFSYVLSKTRKLIEKPRRPICVRRVVLFDSCLVFQDNRSDWNSDMFFLPYKLVLGMKSQFRTMVEFPLLNTKRHQQQHQGIDIAYTIYVGKFVRCLPTLCRHLNTHFRIGRSRYDQKRYYRADKGHALIAEVTTDRCGNIIHMSVANDQLVMSLSSVMSSEGYVLWFVYVGSKVAKFSEKSLKKLRNKEGMGYRVIKE